MTATAIPHFTVHDRLRKAREAAGFDQEHLAEVIGVSARTVGNWERGATSEDAMSHRTLRRWADACHVPIWWLADGDDGGADVANLPTGRNAATGERVTLALVA